MADIRNLSVLPRPRSAWQAMDAGFTLARAHFLPLVLMWLGFSLPVFAICLFIQLWFDLPYMLFVWWWFKPLYELPILFFLSRAVFSENLSVTAAWKLSLKHFWTLFKTYLTLARCSTARAMTYSVVFLEALPRKQRAGRISTLCAVKTRHYLLMLACLHIEYILAYAIITLVGVLFFSSALAEFQWEFLFESLDDPTFQAWMAGASITTLIAAALVAPFYVAGGFLIYINRRMQLEAWDIEHRFRDIKPRAIKSSVIAGVLLTPLLFGTADPAMAQDKTLAQDTTVEQRKTMPEERAESIMTPASAKAAINEILQHKDFGYTKTRTVPVLKERDEDEDDEERESLDLSFLEGLVDAMSSMATIFKIVLWTAVVFFVGLLLYTLFRFKQSFSRPSALTRHRPEGEDAQSHPLTQDLPVDIVATAEQLLSQGQRRQALSVLFRGALRSVMYEHEMKIASGATESDCETSVAAVANQQQVQTFTHLLGVWRKEAYANQPQPEDVIRKLIADWRNAFTLHAHTNTGSTAS